MEYFIKSFLEEIDKTYSPSLLFKNYLMDLSEVHVILYAERGYLRFEHFKHIYVIETIPFAHLLLSLA